MDKKIKKIIGIVLALLVIGLNYSPPVRTFAKLPKQIIIKEGQLREINFGIPVKFDIISNEINDEPSIKADTGTNILGGATTASITSQYNHATAYINVSAFGILPAKKIKIVTMRDREVIACGHSIGVLLSVKGVLVVGFCDIVKEDSVMLSPARDAGVHAGDFIMSVDGTEVKDAVHLADLINQSDGETITLSVRRNDSVKEIRVDPVMDRQDERYHIGIWGRDSSSGIGTLTYIDPSNGNFGALGHPISDMDTGKILDVMRGNIFRSKVVQIHKGLSGQPGELKGEFSGSIDQLGSISNNCKYGIFGTFDEKHWTNMEHKLIKIAANHEIKKGPATLLTTIDGKGVREFECEITKINYDSISTTKNMVIKITDEELLEKTGGIVQGMSGSPLIQDGKLVGAITHVFINDPSSGHAVFISSMVQNGH